MVGDRVNDAPALATADIAISMGVSGSALATETGHVVLMSNDIRKIPKAIKLARKTRREVIENIFFSITTKAGVLAFAFIGHPLVWLAVLADVLTCLIVIGNSMLLLGGSDHSHDNTRYFGLILSGHSHKTICCSKTTLPKSCESAKCSSRTCAATPCQRSKPKSCEPINCSAQNCVTNNCQMTNPKSSCSITPNPCESVKCASSICSDKLQSPKSHQCCAHECATDEDHCLDLPESQVGMCTKHDSIEIKEHCDHLGPNSEDSSNINNRHDKNSFSRHDHNHHKHQQQHCVVGWNVSF